MDYEKAYRNALEKAKRALYCDDKGYVDTDKELILSLFPELKESEDERIRKALIRFHKSTIDVDGIKGEDILAWLEKQGEQKPSDKIKPKFKVGDKIYLKPKYRMPNDDTPIANTVKEIIGIDDDFYRFKGAYIFIEDQDKYELVEQKPIDKVAPKFKVGDWITNGRYAKRIVGINSDWPYYIFEDGTAKRIKDIDERYHLWTIQDAKDGDVLATKWGAFIVKEYLDIINPDGVIAYCGINSMGRFDKCDGIYPWTDEKITPATKEQRELLFQKMKEAGYEWDEEKKELKKIEDENYDCEDYGIDSLFHAQRILEKTLGKVDGYQTDDGILSHKCAIAAVNKLYKQKPAEWSEEDEHTLQGVIDEIQANKNQAPDYDLETYDRFLSWLKSLKNKVAPQKQWEQKGETLSGWWVARDKNGELYVYNVKPERNVLSWEVTNGTYIGLSQKLFPDLKWEDEPIEIDVIIKPKTT